MSKLKHRKTMVNLKIIMIIFEVSFTKQKEENTVKILTSKTLHYWKFWRTVVPFFPDKVGRPTTISLKKIDKVLFDDWKVAKKFESHLSILTMTKNISIGHLFHSEHFQVFKTLRKISELDWSKMVLSKPYLLID